MEIPNKKDWSIYGLRGLRAEVTGKVEALSLPAFVKAFIMAEIDGLPPECRGITVDAYGASLPSPHAETRANCITVGGIKL